MKKEETYKLISMAQNGDKGALNILVENNQGLVHSIARKINNKWEFKSQENLEILTQEGYVGLIKAILRFDISKGFELSTFATHIISGEIGLYLKDRAESRVFRLPRDFYFKYIDIMIEKDKFYQKFSREPTLEEIKEMTGFDYKEIFLTLNSVESYKSIDSRVSDNHKKDITLGEIIEDPNNLTEDTIIHKIEIRRAIKKLGKIERQIIELKYYQNKSQCDIAEIMDISQSYVSRLEKRALNKLKIFLGGGYNETFYNKKRA